MAEVPRSKANPPPSYPPLHPKQQTHQKQMQQQQNIQSLNLNHPNKSPMMKRMGKSIKKLLHTGPSPSLATSSLLTLHPDGVTVAGGTCDNNSSGIGGSETSSIRFSEGDDHSARSGSSFRIGICRPPSFDRLAGEDSTLVNTANTAFVQGHPSGSIPKTPINTRAHGDKVVAPSPRLISVDEEESRTSERSSEVDSKSLVEVEGEDGKEKVEGCLDSVGKTLFRSNSEDGSDANKSSPVGPVARVEIEDDGIVRLVHVRTAEGHYSPMLIPARKGLENCTHTKEGSQHAFDSSQNNENLPSQSVEHDTPSTPNVTKSSQVPSLKTMNAAATSYKIFVLLLQPSTRIFELIQIVFDPLSTTINDLLGLIPTSATEPLLGEQSHRGFCRPKDSTEMTELNAMVSLLGLCNSNVDGNLVDLNDGGSKACARVLRGEVLVAIPEGYTGEKCTQLSGAILENPKLIRILSRPDPLAPRSSSKRGRRRRSKKRNRKSGNGQSSADGEDDSSSLGPPTVIEAVLEEQEDFDFCQNDEEISALGSTAGGASETQLSQMSKKMADSAAIAAATLFADKIEELAELLAMKEGEERKSKMKASLEVDQDCNGDYDVPSVGSSKAFDVRSERNVSTHASHEAMDSDEKLDEITLSEMTNLSNRLRSNLTVQTSLLNENIDMQQQPLEVTLRALAESIRSIKDYIGGADNVDRIRVAQLRGGNVPPELTPGATVSEERGWTMRSSQDDGNDREGYSHWFEIYSLRVMSVAIVLYHQTRFWWSEVESMASSSVAAFASNDWASSPLSLVSGDSMGVAGLFKAVLILVAMVKIQRKFSSSSSNTSPSPSPTASLSSSATETPPPQQCDEEIRLGLGGSLSGAESVQRTIEKGNYQKDQVEEDQGYGQRGTPGWRKAANL